MAGARGGPPRPAEAAALGRAVAAAALLGPGDGDAWTMNPEDLVEDDVGDLLPLRDVDEICLPRTLWANPETAGTQTTGGAWRWQPGDPRAV